MGFRILGNLEVEAGGRRLALGGPCERKLLAVLLLDNGHVVPLTRLVDALWDEDPPVTAAKQARNAVSRLRGLLAGVGAPGVIETRGGGYRLVVADDALDASRFERLVAQAQRAAPAGEVAQAARLLRSALDLWRGPFLAGMDCRVAETAAAAWNERRCAVAEAYYDHQLALGQHAEITAGLRAMVADHPLREKPVGQLMLALYRCGRQADALALYRDTRALLAEEVGLDPGPELRGLQQQILTADTSLALTSGRPAAGPRSAVMDLPRLVPRQLPAALRHFVGRTDEQKALTSLLDQVAEADGTVVISAIDGMAGIGKTALAVHWAQHIAERFPDGQLYVNLRGFDPSGAPVAPAEAIRGFLDALGVPPARIPAALDTQAGLYRSLLADQRVLVLLDNARDVTQVRPLLPGSPGCLVIITSRSQLPGLVVSEGAWPLTLGVLADDEARELLARRLGTERIAAEPAAAEALIRLCARLPLALSIAAARALSRPGFSLATLAAEVSDARSRLDALAAGDAAADVRAVFSWSYQSLDPAAARMFRLLGAHPGPDISLQAAASLAGIPPDEARDATRELARAGLITEHVPGRFAFHDLLRAYAAEKSLGRGGERGQARHRMLDHYLHTAYAAALLLNPPTRHPISLDPARPGAGPEAIGSGERALAWFEAEFRVLLAVIQVADDGPGRHAWQLPWTLALFSDRGGHWHDWSAAQQVALAAAERLGDTAGQAHAHLDLGYVGTRLGRHQAADSHLARSLSLFRQLGDRLNQAHLHTAFCIARERQGQHGESLSHARQALDLYRAAGHKAGQATGLNAVGYSCALLGEHESALAYCQEALSLHQELGNRHGEAAVWDSLGYSHSSLGHSRIAVSCYQRALALFRELGDRYDQADVLLHLGDAQQAGGAPHAARAAWRSALGILDDLSHPDAETVRARLRPPPGRPPGTRSR